MKYKFVFEDGRNNLVDENGRPVSDSIHLYDVLPLVESEKNCSCNKDEGVLAAINPDDSNEKKSESRSGSTRPYRKYEDCDKENLINQYTLQPFVAVSKLADSLNIERRTAQRWIKRWKENESLPDSPRGRKKKLLEEQHKSCVVEYLDGNPSGGVEDVMLELLNNFENLEISKAAVQRFISNECNFSFNISRRDSSLRNSPENIEKRYDFVKLVKSSGVDYCKNCVFIGDARVDLIRLRGSSPSRNNPVVATLSKRSDSRTVLSAWSIDGIIKVGLSFPIEWQKNTELQDDIPDLRFTRPFKHFIMDVMDVLDTDNRFRSYFLVMDDRCRQSLSIENTIVARGYRYLYLPPFSPELNPTEQMWSLTKSYLRRERLLPFENFSVRITEAANQIHTESIQNCIQHSVNCFSTCLNKEPL
ncbi:hypothetical protein G9P44_005263 [Scheffersomyces stipitis]|nr:hypothetical protein G9P44_005263 [Scheffersomyces stipitis]